MKFAHLADSHLGYRQYGLVERELDFYETFDRCIDKIIEEKCDFVIHSGDLFEYAKPSPNALFRFQRAFLRLKKANIPVYAIAGNHDSVKRKGALPPQILFKDLGLRLLSPRHPMDSFNGVLICGMPYTSESNKPTLMNAYKEFEKEADKHIVSILVAHQGIDKYIPQYELEIGDLPKNFDYYAMGHLHKYINDAYGKGRLVYPGSSEIWKSDEVGDYSKKGKGFAIVEIGVGEPLVKRISVNLSRKFLKEHINYEDLDKKIAFIKNKIKDLEKQPILDVIVENGDFSVVDVYEKIMNELDPYCLLVRPSFQPNNSIVDEKLINKDFSLGSKQLLSEAINDKYKNETITKFGLQLLDALSKDDLVEAEVISDKFYKTNFISDDLREKQEQLNLYNYSNSSDSTNSINQDSNNSNNPDSIKSNDLNDESGSDSNLNYYIKHNKPVNIEQDKSTNIEPNESDNNSKKPRIINKTSSKVQETLIKNDKKVRYEELIDKEPVKDKNQTTLFGGD